MKWPRLSFCSSERCCVYLNVCGFCIILFTVLPSRISDRGNETTVIATMHSFLGDMAGDLDNVADSIIYGSSTENKIERW